MVETGWTDVAELLSWFGESRNIGPRIKHLRENRRSANGLPDPWTQERLADEVSQALERSAGSAVRKLDKQAIWKIENSDKPSANRSVTVDELIAFARALDVTIADLLLPGDHVDQLDAFKAVTDAARQLQDVREAWQRYGTAIRTARARLRASEDAQMEMQSQLARTRREHYQSFASQHRRHAPERSLEAFAAGQPPTPLLAAMEDALGPLEPHHTGWANGRHEPPLDAGDFVYSGGA